MEPLGQGFGKHGTDNVEQRLVIESFDGEGPPVSCQIFFPSGYENVHALTLPFIQAEGVTHADCLLGCIQVAGLCASIKSCQLCDGEVWGLNDIMDESGDLMS